MFVLFNFNSSNIRIIYASIIAYIFVNLFENMIHYNIGRFSNKDIKFMIPTKKDWFKIITVMLIFAIIQGILTIYLNKIL
jgi:uncharacterized PurR-regulated membrane protein YhhQ (DUF165 family)